MKRKYFVYQGKYSNTYRIASAEDSATVGALLGEGWMRITLSEVRSLRRCEKGNVATEISTAYIDDDGALMIVNPD